MNIEGFIYNAALLITGSIIHSYIFAKRSYQSPLWNLLNGLLYGVMAILAMSKPMTLAPGVIFDTRSVILSLGGLFGGPVVAGISSLIAVAYRVFIGGSGLISGVGSVLISAGLGVGYRYFIKGKVTEIKLFHLFGFGLLVSVLLLVLFRYALPGDVALTALKVVAVPFLTIHPVVTMLIGHFVISQIKRIRLEYDLSESRKMLRELTAHLQNLREVERAVIAREVHDEFGQNLAVIKMKLVEISDLLNVNDFQSAALIGTVIVQVDETISTAKRLFSELRPGLLDDLGIFASIEWLALDFKKRTGIPSECSLKEPEAEIPKALVTDIFRTVQMILSRLSTNKITNIHFGSDFDRDRIRFDIRAWGIESDKELFMSGSEINLLEIEERLRGWEGKVQFHDGDQSSILIQIQIPMSKLEEKTDDQSFYR